MDYGSNDNDYNPEYPFASAETTLSELLLWLAGRLCLLADLAKLHVDVASLSEECGKGIYS